MNGNKNRQTQVELDRETRKEAIKRIFSLKDKILQAHATAEKMNARLKKDLNQLARVLSPY